MNDLEIINRKLQDFLKEILSIHEILSINVQRINALDIKFSEIDRLKDLYNRFDSLSKTVMNHCIVTNEKYEDLKSSLSALESNLKEFCVKSNHLQDSIFSIKDSLDKHVIKNDVKHLSSESNSQCMFDNLDQKLKNSIESLKKELSVSPKQVFLQNAEFIKSMEKSSSDSSNAMLLINKQANQMRILESKLDQVMVQIRNLDISSKK